MSRVVTKMKNFLFSIKVKQLLLPIAENNLETHFLRENVEMCKALVVKINEQLNLPETRQFLVK